MKRSIVLVVLAALLSVSAGFGAAPEPPKSPQPQARSGFHYFGWGGDVPDRKAFLYKKETIYIVQVEDVISDGGVKYQVQSIADSLVTLRTVKTKEAVKLPLERIQIAEKSRFGKVTKGGRAAPSRRAAATSPQPDTTAGLVALAKTLPSGPSRLGQEAPSQAPPDSEGETQLFKEWATEPGSEPDVQVFDSLGEGTGWQLIAESNEGDWGGDFFFEDVGDSGQSGVNPEPESVGPAVIMFNPPSPAAAVGSQFGIDVQVQNVSNLYSIQIALTANPQNVEIVGVLEGSFLSSDDQNTLFSPSIDNQAGRLSVSLSRAGSPNGISGGGMLFSVSMRARAPGLSDIRLTQVTLTDAKGMPVPTHLQRGGLVQVRIK
jgi:hypothetical protein